MHELVGKVFKVLDFGEIMLMDHMGSDQSIVDNARVSYKKGTKKIQDDASLLRYLMRHIHATPFGTGNVMKFYMKLPIFVERQWARHRTAWWNEVSARYSELPEEFYVPPEDQICFQDKKNRQGRAEPLPTEAANLTLNEQREQAQDAFFQYHAALARGVARETARLPLPLSTYTEKVWSIDLWNMLHLLSLRMDKHAQWEIREFADVMGHKIVSQLYPITWQAFVDFRLESMRLSRLDVLVINQLSKFKDVRDYEAKNIANMAVPQWKDLEKCTERDECIAKCRLLGLVI